MKTTFYFLTLLLLTISQTSAQSPITVGGTCSDPEALGVYVYDGDINGKPSYRKGIDCSTLMDEPSCDANGSFDRYFVRWNGAAWEWIKEGNGCMWFIVACLPKEPTGVGIGIVLASSPEDTNLPACNSWTAAVTNCVPNITGCETLSTIDNTFSNSITMHPNPTNGKVSINFGTTNKSISISLSNLMGQIIWKKDLNNSSSFQFEINQPAGLYLIEITGEKGQKAYIKALKE